MALAPETTSDEVEVVIDETNSGEWIEILDSGSA